MSDEIRVLDGEVDLERDDVRDSRGRRIATGYVARAVADVHHRRGRRPLRDDTPATGHAPRVSFRVPEQTRRRAEERARTEGRSVSEIAREALERYLAS
jgi:hypothetical protein